MNVELHARFFGRVQGVGFRAGVAFAAKRLGLSGTVENLEDGSVAMIAQGPQETLEKLLKEIDTVIFPGHVSRLDKKFTEIQTKLPSFVIL